MAGSIRLWAALRMPAKSSPLLNEWSTTSCPAARKWRALNSSGGFRKHFTLLSPSYFFRLIDLHYLESSTTHQAIRQYPDKEKKPRKILIRFFLSRSTARCQTENLPSASHSSGVVVPVVPFRDGGGKYLSSSILEALIPPSPSTTCTFQSNTTPRYSTLISRASLQAATALSADAEAGPGFCSRMRVRPSRAVK